ncbi:hypothetical protein Tco_0429725 [Tanacetum coccineum]
MIHLPLSFLIIDGMLTDIGDDGSMTITLEDLVTLGVATLAVVKIAVVGKLPLAVATVGETHVLAVAIVELVVVKTDFEPPLARIFATSKVLKTLAISPVVSLPLSALFILLSNAFSHLLIILKRLDSSLQLNDFQILTLNLFCHEGMAEVLVMFSLSCPTSKLVAVGKPSPCLSSPNGDAVSSAPGEGNLD